VTALRLQNFSDSVQGKHFLNFGFNKGGVGKCAFVSHLYSRRLETGDSISTSSSRRISETTREDQ